LLFMLVIFVRSLQVLYFHPQIMERLSVLEAQVSELQEDNTNE
jgi:hypothetical protein